MPALKGTKTHDNLKTAFAGESQANRRYLYFAQKADVEGYPDVSALFRSVAEGETGHAFGHFDFLAEVGDPVTGVAVGPTPDNLKSAIEGETYEYTEMYPGFAKTARDEGFDEIAEWLETLARAEKSHAGRFTSGLESVSVARVQLHRGDGPGFRPGPSCRRRSLVTTQFYDPIRHDRASPPAQAPARPPRPASPGGRPTHAQADDRRHQGSPRVRARTRRLPGRDHRHEEAPPHPPRRLHDDRVRERGDDALPDPGDGPCRAHAARRADRP